MLSKAFAWGVTSVFILSLAWWIFDPQGFSQNPVLSWLRELTLRSQGYRH
jgi:hypothetical protein